MHMQDPQSFERRRLQLDLRYTAIDPQLTSQPLPPAYSNRQRSPPAPVQRCRASLRTLLAPQVSRPAKQTPVLLRSESFADSNHYRSTHRRPTGAPNDLSRAVLGQPTTLAPKCA